MANTSINLATLDFETIKANLKSHLRNQDIFKDYDFDGSNMSVLLDILAYNTSLQAFYMNQLAGESFLDSAQLRSSVVSHAKELNYRPRSARSAKATIRLRVEQNNSDTLIIPKGTSFTTTYNFQTYTFTTNEIKSYYAPFNEATQSYIFETDDIDIYEGFYIFESFVMNYANEAQRFILSNADIDTNSLVVNSIEDGGSNIVNYTEGSSLLGLTNQSRKYFVQSVEQGKYEIIFGDDIIGRRPVDGATISVQYRVSKGSDANGAKKFAPDADLTSDSSGRVVVTTIASAAGGDAPESISSIKFNAPRHFQTQERAITASDYETILRAQFPEIDAISVYGGENVNPPQYGKVFISVSINGVEGVPNSKKNEYRAFIKPKMPNPIQPEFVDPNFLYARISSRVKYNLNITNLKPDEIKLLVLNKITEYETENLRDFNSTLYSSNLIADIDDAHESMVSNSTEILVYKKIVPVRGVFQNIDIQYGLPLRDDIPAIAASHSVSELRTIYSSPFTVSGDTMIIEDDGEGTLRLMRAESNALTLVKNIGTVDYNSGVLQISNFAVEDYEGQSIRVYAQPKAKDITSAFNDVFRIEPSETVILVEAVRK
jgi:hypothetical protein